MKKEKIVLKKLSNIDKQKLGSLHTNVLWIKKQYMILNLFSMNL